MSAGKPDPSTVTVTLIIRNSCGACAELLKEIKPNLPAAGVIFKQVNLTTDELPAFAQGVIVPATYIGNTLWRYGVYPAEGLTKRIETERERLGLSADS